MTTATSRAAPSRWALLAAFAAIYVVWGSSYVFIHFAVETIPPFLMGGLRFSLAGLLMIGWARAHGARLPTWVHWRSAAVGGVLLFLINNGALVWAAQAVPSSMMALLVGITPMWMVLLDWWRPSVRGRQAGGVRPTNWVFAGLVAGFFGITLLVSPGDFAAGSTDAAIGVVAILIGTVGWAVGSLYTRQASLPDSPILTTGMQLFTGGVMLLALSATTGELGRFNPADVSPVSLLAWVQLVIFGSVIGYGSYVWLLRVSTPARVATYAYVNPIVAVFLGWALAGETITLRTVLAAAIIIGSVMLINNTRQPKPAARAVLAEAASEIGV